MNKLGIPGFSTDIFVKGSKLGYTEGPLKMVVQEPSLAGVSDLRELLVSEGWLTPDYLVVKGNRLMTMRDPGTKNRVPEVSGITGWTEVGAQWYNPDASDKDQTEMFLSELREYQELYNQYIMCKEDNLGEYRKFISSRDILGNKSEVCLGNPKSGVYTSIVNLNSQLNNNTPVLIKLGVSYSKGSEIYSKDLVVPPEDMTTTGNQDFTLEYADGCLRVFPESPEVTECIISYCYLMYEHLI